MKRILFLLLVLSCVAPVFGAMTYDQAYYRNNRGYLGSATSNDPLYNLWGTLEGLYEGTEEFDGIRILESTGATYYTTISCGDQSGNLTFKLPTTAGSNGQVLTTNGSGTLSWGAAGGTFTGGNIASDVVLNADGVDILADTTTAHTFAIKGYADAGAYKDVLRWTNGAAVAMVLGASDVTFSLASTGLDVSTAGAISGAAGITNTGVLTSAGGATNLNTSGSDAVNIGTGTYSGTVTVGNNGASVAFATSAWDLSGAGVLSGITEFSLSGDITMANGKGILSSTTTAQTVGVYGYDNNGAARVGAVVITNGDTPATVLGNPNGTTAISSSDWAVSATGDMTNIGAITLDGDLTSTDQFAFTFADNAEEGTITTSATDYGADAAVVTVLSSGAGATNNTYLLRLRNNANADAQDHFLVLEDNNADDKLAVNSGGDFTSTLDAAANFTIDGSTTASTTTGGVLDVDMSSATTGGDAVNVKVVSTVGMGETTAAITLDLDDDTAAAGNIYGIDMAASDAVGSSTLYGINIANSIETHINSALAAAGTWAAVDASSAASTNAAGVFDASYSTVTNGAAFMNLDMVVGDAGAGVTAHGILIDLDDDTASNAATINGVSVTSADLTGHASTAVQAFYTSGCDAAFQADNGYVRIGTGSSPDVAPGDDDLYVEGTAEVDGAARFDGAITANSTITGDGGDAMAGFLKAVVNDTDDEILTVAGSGKVFTNAGDGNPETYTLPAAAAGLEFTFIVMAAQELRIDPTGDDVIYINAVGADAGEYWTANAVGESVHLIAVDATNWIAISHIGTWTQETP